jgi:hypothetical protein
MWLVVFERALAGIAAITLGNLAWTWHVRRAGGELPARAQLVGDVLANA